MKVQSNGWGVQSVTLMWMQALDEIERCDVILHSDTTHESSLTYAYIERWTPELEARGLKFATVSAPRLRGALDEYGACMIPAHIEGRGMFSRQCTDNWKRAPLRRWMQANRNGERIEQWIGISLDEALRMKPSDVKYITHRWPLIERRMTRAACMSFLEKHGIEVPPKSSCVFCPYHDTRAWQELKASGNGDWHKAVEVDRAIRKARPPYDLFVHPARIPLEDVDLRTPQEKGQLSLWDEECTGLCGI